MMNDLSPWTCAVNESTRNSAVQSATTLANAPIFALHGLTRCTTSAEALIGRFVRTLSAFYVTPTWIEKLHWAIWLVVLQAGNREVTTKVQGERQADAMWSCKLWILNSAKIPSYRKHCTQISLRVPFPSVHPNAVFSPLNVAPLLNSHGSAWSTISLIPVTFSSALLPTTRVVYSSIDATAPPLLVILHSTRSAL